MTLIGLERMTDLDRRKLLSSLAATTACAPVVSVIYPLDASARRGGHRETGHTFEGWLLARESRPQPTDCAVDFWARPLCDVPYTKHLPREIARAAMWFDQTNQLTLESIDQSFKHYCFDWADKPRRFAAHLDGIDLSSTLRSLVGDQVSNSAARTAFISLDSLGPLREPSWAEVLPAFRSCYDHIIGHFHMPQRGLRQWRAFLNAHCEDAYFQEYFVNTAAQCDAVIVTSPALVESDLRCCPRASTEELVGKLMRGLGCALLTPAVLQQIVGAAGNGMVRKPRLFALSSMVLETMDDYYFHSDLLLGRQGELVRGSFGDGKPDERLLLVATAAEDPHSELLEEVPRAAGTSFLTTNKPAYEVEKRGYGVLNHLRIITLWPFQLDETKLRAS